jgi:two-component system, cell cycle sensor histidine kinase and response regulator CckA
MNPDKPNGGAGRPAGILVVDDTPANLQVLAGMLKDRGYKVRPVPSGKLALAAAQHDPPDLILLDINMPEMNGYEVCERLKADDKLKGIPVIFISALTEQLDKVKAFAVGGVDYLTKPFQIEELHARVETHLKLHRLQIELEEYQDYDIFKLDPAGNVASWNPGAEKAVGYKAEEIIGRHISCFYTTEDAAAGKPQRGLQIALEAGRFEEEGLRLRKGGTPFWADVTISNIHDSLGRHVGFTHVLRDVTERKQAEETLRLRDRAIESLIQGLCITDPARLDNPIIYVNDSFLRMTGYAREDVIGKNCRFLQGPNTAPEAIERLRLAIRDGESCLVELLNYRKDGASFWNGLSISPIRDAAGQVANFVGVLTDVSPLKLMEQQLQQTHKMEAVGQLAGGVAHDFNNLLTVISGYSELLLDMLPSDDPKREAVKEIRDAGERAAGLTGQLLSFSRQAVLETKVLDLNEVVKEMEKLLGRMIGEDILLTAVLDPSISRIKADPGQIGQVLMNLAVNARDAMPQGGNLTIETKDVYLDEAYAAQHLDCKPGRYVLLVVSDNGCGMPPEVQVRIFEPFFSTKGPGKGTGLGLATVYGIIKQSGGNVNLYTEPGHGTAFKIYLPAVDVQLDPKAHDQRDAQVTGGTETILLVEDEAAVRAIAVLALHSQGYTVLHTESGEKALRIIERHLDPIDLLVTDVVMPGMNGRELAEALCLQYPGLKVLYLSGYTDDSVIRHGILQAEVAFLHKPYTPLLLAKKVREVLDMKGRPPEAPDLTGGIV